MLPFRLIIIKTTTTTAAAIIIIIIKDIRDNVLPPSWTSKYSEMRILLAHKYAFTVAACTIFTFSRSAYAIMSTDELHNHILKHF